MTGAPTWTILVPTVAHRADLFDRLLGELLPQLPAAGHVRVLAYLNHGEPSLGHIRDALVRAADTDYVSFIDDDDVVSVQYVSRICEALAGRPDHVGFWLNLYQNGILRERVRHSIGGPRRWGRVRGVLHRDFTHIDPIRTELALRGTFVPPRPGRPEDRHWVRQVRPYVRTEQFIDEPMYEYLHRPDRSIADGRTRLEAGARPPVSHPHFAWHPDSD